MSPRKPVQLQAALSKQAIDATAQRYLGSMVATDERHSWFSQRSLYEITDESVTDPVAKNIFRTIAESAMDDDEFDFKPRSIAYRMIENDSLGQVEDIEKATQALASRLEELASYGAKTLKEFRRLEGLFAEKLKFDRAQHVQQRINEIMQAKNGKSMADKVEEARQYLEELSGQFVPQTRSANAEQQGTILDQMHADTLAKEGLVDITFPPHFGIFATILRPKRKELVTISGPSGGGKSILVHLFAEWLMRNGYRVLFILTEDDLETTLTRATCRHVPGTTFLEIDGGDPRGKKQKYKEMLLKWKEQGGEIVYEERPGITGTELSKLIENKLIEAKASGQPFTAVFVDYFQDIDFDTDAVAFGNNRVAAAGQCAVRLRALAQKHNCLMVVASQETVYGDDVKTAWSKRLVEKSQIWLRFAVANADDDVSVFLKFFAKGDPKNDWLRIIARTGEQLPFMYMICEKANRGAKGKREALFRFGQKQCAWAIQFYKDIRKNPEIEWQPVPFELVNENFFAKQDEGFAVANATVEQVDPWEHDPLKKRRNGH